MGQQLVPQESFKGCLFDVGSGLNYEIFQHKQIMVEFKVRSGDVTHVA